MTGLLTPTINDLPGLKAVVEVANRYNLSQEIKPCVAACLNRWFSDLETPSAADAAFYIAVELRRLGVKRERALTILEAWNVHNITQRKPTALKGCVKSAWVKEYPYKCNTRSKGLYGTAYCIGHDLCPFYRASGQTSAGDYGGPWMLYVSGWGPYLTARERDVYCGIQAVERIRHITPGSTVYCGYRQLNELIGLSLKHIGPALEGLEAKGLILLKKGSPQGRGKAATEITRVVPIPPPNACSLVPPVGTSEGGK